MDCPGGTHWASRCAEVGHQLRQPCSLSGHGGMVGTVDVPRVRALMVWAIGHLARGVSIETKEKQSLLVRTNYQPSVLGPEGRRLRFPDPGLKAALDDGVRTGRGNLDGPGSQFECLRWGHRVSHDLLWFLGSLSRVIRPQLAGPQDETSFSSQCSKSEGSRKLRNVNVEGWSQILEETRRIQDPVQFTGRLKKKKKP